MISRAYRLPTLIGAILCAVAAGPSIAADAESRSTFTSTQREEIGRLVREYLLANPEVITEAVQVLQEREEAKAESARLDIIKKREKELFQPAEDTVLGNPKGKTTVVEFFDYNCGYCKQIFPDLMAAVREDGDVRLVVKEFPILGPASVTATKAALASRKQNKYAEYHVALLGHKGSLSNDTVMRIAKETGLDMAKLEQDMKDPSLDKIIEANRGLAQELEIQGTPALIVGDAFVPGAIDKDAIKELIKKARE